MQYYCTIWCSAVNTVQLDSNFKNSHACSYTRTTRVSLYSQRIGEYTICWWCGELRTSRISLAVLACRCSWVQLISVRKSPKQLSCWYLRVNQCSRIIHFSRKTGRPAQNSVLEYSRLKINSTTWHNVPHTFTTHDWFSTSPCVRISSLWKNAISRMAGTATLNLDRKKGKWTFSMCLFKPLYNQVPL